MRQAVCLMNGDGLVRVQCLIKVFKYSYEPFCSYSMPGLSETVPLGNTVLALIKVCRTALRQDYCI